MAPVMSRLAWRPPPNPLLLGLLAVAGSIAWTLVGTLAAALGRQARPFLEEWLRIQGFFAVIAGLYLGMLSLSDTLNERVRALPAGNGPLPPIRRFSSWLRWAVAGSVALFGSYTTIRLGFHEPPPATYFYWATCLLVCVLAGCATWHVFDVLATAAALESISIDVFLYSPGKTRSLTLLSAYFTSYGVAMTVGYVFALAGTLLGRWRGDPLFVRVVQILWPTIYVPTCLAVLLYPQLALYQRIRAEKAKIIAGYQRQINAILRPAERLDAAAIQQVNALADLIERIEKTPSMALTIPLALTTITTGLVNLASLLVPQSVIAAWLQKHLLP